MIVDKKTIVSVDCIDRCERKLKTLCAIFYSIGVQKMFFLQLFYGFVALFIGVFFKDRRMCAL